MKPAVKRRMDQLVDLIHRYDHLYYVKNTQEVADAVYDQLYKELLDLEAQYPEAVQPTSPTQRLVTTRSAGFGVVKHVSPMLSIHTFTSDEIDPITSFHRQVCEQLNLKECKLMPELKFDGVSLSLQYQDGVLVAASTRGDGEQGEDVTLNARVIRSIPLRLTQYKFKKLEIRGEVVILREHFKKLNEDRLQADEAPYKNPRNAASGCLRQLDPSVTARSYLTFIAYEIASSEGGTEPVSQEAVLVLLEQLGFFIFYDEAWRNEWLKASTKLTHLYNFYYIVRDHRARIQCDIDGVVFKVAQRGHKHQLEAKSNEVGWAMAYKFPPEQAMTQIQDIVLQVGRLGTLTPVAIVKPVYVGGVTITNITLHNQDEIDRKDIRIGDTVIVQRAGDVIPELVEVMKHLRTAGTKKYQIADHAQVCPCCKSPVEREEDKSAYRCTGGYRCNAQRARLIAHFCSRQAMDIEGIGEVLAEKMAEMNFVEDISQLYKLHLGVMTINLGLGEVQATKILYQLLHTKATPELYRLIYGLGIPGVGVSTARDLANHFGTIHKFIQAPEAELLQVKDIGKKTAQSIVKYFEEGGKRIVLHILHHVKPQSIKKATKELEGFTFVITGSFSELTRDQLKELILAKGGKVTSSLSPRVNYLITGEFPGTKLKEAQNLGIRNITLGQLKTLKAKGA